MHSNDLDPVKQLLNMLESGQYPPQTRIPPERNLSEELGITRTALRKALSVLEAENKIWRHVGKGTFVGAKPAPDDTIVLSGVTNTTNPGEIMEARLVLEPKLAAMSAHRATQNDIVRIQLCLNEAESAEDFTTFEHWDEALHLAIAESSHNLLLISLFKTVNSLRQNKIWGRLKEAAMSDKRQMVYKRHHRNLVEAINDRNAPKAEKTMRIHLEEVQKNLLGNI